MKKGVLVFAGLFLLVFLSSGIFAEQVCFAVSGACPSGQTKMLGISDSTNAHGELASLTNYGYSICCNFAGDTQCEVDGSNKVIGLSSTTNAHAEVPLETNYETDVCYGDLSCISSTDECGTATAVNHPLGILSLSASTNAHIGALGDYTTKICCTSPTVSSAYWSKNGNTVVSSTDVVPGTTELKIVVKNLEASIEYNFEVWERDASNDDEITTKSGTTDANGRAVVSWIVTQEDLDNGADDDGNLVDEEFYFKVLNAGNLIATSGNLDIGTIYSAAFCDDILFCDLYAEENNCMEDVCAVATFSVGNFSCDSLAGESCYCNWDSEDSTCAGVAETLIFNEEGEPEAWGCLVNAAESSDDCADGEIVYDYTGIPTLNGEEVPDVQSCNGVEDCISCFAGGTQRIQCPSLVQLPFFGAYNLIIAGLLITLIYVIFNFMERKKKSSKSRRRR